MSSRSFSQAFSWPFCSLNALFFAELSSLHFTVNIMRLSLCSGSY
jgi:hypothetical protein